MAGSNAIGLRDLTTALCADHRALEVRWCALRRVVVQVQVGKGAATATTLAAADVQGFVDLYEQHIAREEAELLPLAAGLLGGAELDRVGLAMRARRGVA